MTPPTISMVKMWWSFPLSRAPTGMQLFHHDRGDFRSCNLFVYLSDVSEVTGPHSFVTHTHELEVLSHLIAKRLGHNPSALSDFWKWMEVHRKTDDDVDKYFREDEIKLFTGPKGTSFLEDTRGLHKATIPILGPRLAFEIVYTVLPKYNEVVDPIRRCDLKFEKAHKNYEEIDPLVKYATRLIYQ